MELEVLLNINILINERYKFTTKDRINKVIKSPGHALYTYAALINGYKYIRCKEYNIKKYLIASPKLNGSFSENNSKNIHNIINEYHKIIREFINNF